ncbi:hypothetical protein EXU57_19580 [Segetibacter sp. 3557_3]|uniref:hypothetical protein n=1 Tax=Segetibacter sp. 3557_3 TaxID=2547429 RepID=UPI001058AD98|nr:hypothetical protein [Segetibacter sp. 3557_3]TDH21403.1 hypothetical protein EXU57_19580 [Segetibacter sp. 3557_3]
MEISRQDITAAAFAASLVENGMDQSKVLIVPTGASKRSCRTDVAWADQPVVAEADPYHIIRTPRQGLYDRLPEGLFHAPALREKGGGLAAAIDAMKRRRAEEQAARNFFLPFEVALHDVAVSLALVENSFSDPAMVNEVALVFKKFWPLLEILDRRQSAIFIKCIPFLHELRDDHHQISALLTDILLVPVTVSLAQQQVPAPPVTPPMGAAFLGIDVVTDGPAFGEMEILIAVGPMDVSRHAGFIEGGADRRILEQLIDYLLPADMDVLIAPELKKEDRVLRCRNHNDSNCLLGFDTYL